MSDALTLIRRLRADLCDPAVVASRLSTRRAERAHVLARLERIEAVMAAAGQDPAVGHLVDAALRAIDRLGGNASPLTLGHAMRPTMKTEDAEQLGAAMLKALRKRGHALPTGANRWTITVRGTAAVRDELAEARP